MHQPRVNKSEFEVPPKEWSIPESPLKRIPIPDAKKLVPFKVLGFALEPDDPDQLADYYNVSKDVKLIYFVQTYLLLSHTPVWYNHRKREVSNSPLIF